MNEWEHTVEVYYRKVSMGKMLLQDVPSEYLDAVKLRFGITKEDDTNE